MPSNNRRRDDLSVQEQLDQVFKRAPAPVPSKKAAKPKQNEHTLGVFVQDTTSQAAKAGRVVGAKEETRQAPQKGSRVLNKFFAEINGSKARNDVQHHSHDFQPAFKR
jgi:hypothetical protein